MHICSITHLLVDDEDRKTLDRAYTLCYFLKEMAVAKTISDGGSIYELTEQIIEDTKQLSELLCHDISLDMEYACKLKTVVNKVFEKRNCT